MTDRQEGVAATKRHIVYIVSESYALEPDDYAAIGMTPENTNEEIADKLRDLYSKHEFLRDWNLLPGVEIGATTVWA